MDEIVHLAACPEHGILTETAKRCAICAGQVEQVPFTPWRYTVSVLVPVLARPHRVQPLLDSLIESMPPPHLGLTAELVVVCSEADEPQIEAVRAAGLQPVILPGPRAQGDYARKINLAARQATAEFVFLGADDLRFFPGWLEQAIATHLTTHACVIGTNDLGNPRVVAGNHSTHFLVHREYLSCGLIDSDEPAILYEGYDHNFVDAELIGTATHRRTYAHSPGAQIEHLHPNWQKGQHDETYKLGLARFEQDRILYMNRKLLWRG